MKKILENKFLVLIIGVVTFSVGVYAGRTYPASEIEYSSDKTGETNVEGAINELYKVNDDFVNLKSKGNATSEDILTGKTAIVQGEEITGTGISSGYVAYFAGKKSINTSAANLPISYFNENYGTKSGDTITITKPGTYRVLGFAQHSPLESYYTTNLSIYVSKAYFAGASNNYFAANNANSTFTVSNSPVTVNATYKADGNVSEGVSAAAMVVIKES